MKLTQVALAVMLSAPMFASAGVTITPMVGYQTFDNIMKNDPQPQIGVGYRMGSFGVEGVYNKGTAGLVDSDNNRFTNQDDIKNDGTADYEQYRIDGQYYLPNGGSKFEPYLAAGVGEIVIKTTDLRPNRSVNPGVRDRTGKGAYTQLNAGGGLLYAINDFLKLRADSRYIGWSMGDGFGGKNHVDDVQTSLGLMLALGAPKPVANVPAPEVVPVAPTPVPTPTPAPADSDNDGVVDADDQCPNTPANVVVDSTGCPKMIDEQVKMELRVFFDTNKSIIKPVFKPEIAKAADMLKTFPESTAKLEGHTDNRGSRSLNDRLSLARANAVKNMLVKEYGVDSKRLTAEGFAFTRPVASNDTAEGRAMNRRVYAVITGGRKVQATR